MTHNENIILGAIINEGRVTIMLGDKLSILKTAIKLCPLLRLEFSNYGSGFFNLAKQLDSLKSDEHYQCLSVIKDHIEGRQI